MVSPRILSFFALVYGGIILTVIIGRAAFSMLGTPGGLLVTVVGAIVTTAAVYFSDQRYAVQKEDAGSYKDIQSKWRDELYK